MAISRQVILTGLSLLAQVQAQIPTAMLGTWSGNVTQSITGPHDGPGAPPWQVYISSPDAAGNYFVRQLGNTQLFRVQHGLMQYCFLNGTDESPFMVASSDSNRIQFCWRGPRLPTHKAQRSGCDCAQWTLELDNANVLHSTFMQSPPAVHMKMDLFRQGPPPTAEDVLSGWTCHFNNHTGPYALAKDLKRPLAKHSNHVRSTELVHSQERGILTSLVTKKEVPVNASNCVLLNPKHRVRLEYVPSKLPCMPCDVTFAVTADTLDKEYIAIGFKGMGAEYHEAPIVPELPEYWGMSTSHAHSNLTRPLGGRIILAYVDSNRQSCLRQMRADAYAGPPSDVQPDGVIRDTVVRRTGGQTTFKFTVSMNAGHDAEEIYWKGQGFFGRLRVMWAIGGVGNDGCAAPVSYHGAARALTHLNFPGAFSACDKQADSSQQLGGLHSMLNTDSTVIV